MPKTSGRKVSATKEEIKPQPIVEEVEEELENPDDGEGEG